MVCDRLCVSQARSGLNENEDISNGISMQEIYLLKKPGQLVSCIIEPDKECKHKIYDKDP